MKYNNFGAFMLEEALKARKWHKAKQRVARNPRWSLNQTNEIIRDARDSGAITQEEYTNLMRNK